MLFALISLSVSPTHPLRDPTSQSASASSCVYPQGLAGPLSTPLAAAAAQVQPHPPSTAALFSGLGSCHTCQQYPAGHAGSAFSSNCTSLSLLLSGLVLFRLAKQHRQSSPNRRQSLQEKSPVFIPAISRPG
jgi:hypothetical protein